jgi:hypothetical protein
MYDIFHVVIIGSFDLEGQARTVVTVELMIGKCDDIVFDGWLA